MPSLQGALDVYTDCISVACRLTGFTVPLAHGKGFFFGPVGLLPFQEAINVVIGQPVAVKQYTGILCLLFNS